MEVHKGEYLMYDIEQQDSVLWRGSENYCIDFISQKVLVW